MSRPTPMYYDAATAYPERPTLYSLSADFRQAADLLAAEFDPSNPDECAAVLSTLNAIGGLLRHKVESIAGLTRELDLSADMCDAEAKRLAERRDSRRRKADFLRGYMLGELGTAGLDRVETERFTVSVRTNPPAVQVLDASAVPHEFNKTVITTSVDKRATLDHVKATGEVPSGLAVSRSTRLEIR